MFIPSVSTGHVASQITIRFLAFVSALVVLATILSSCASSPELSKITKIAGTQEGLASYYGNEFNGRKTSNGETFNNSLYTAAHRTFPFGTRLSVTNLKNGNKVEVRVNDRGPVKPERVIDLTYAAAKTIGLIRDGIARVRLEVIEWGGKEQHLGVAESAKDELLTAELLKRE